MDRSEPNAGVLKAITPTLYARLRWIARGMLTGLLRPSLSPTDLVSCALVRIEKSGASVPSTPPSAARGPILALAKRAMRSCLVERIRRRTSRLAREADHARGLLPTQREHVALTEWIRLIGRLHEIDARKALVFEMRAVRGMTVEATAFAIGVGHRTVESDYRLARAWLQGEAHRMGWIDPTVR